MAIRRFSNSSIATGAKSSKLWDGETFPGYFESIATYVVPSNTNSPVEFSNIPQTYQHLQLRTFSRGITPGATGAAVLRVRFNDDTTAAYTYHQLRGTTGAGSEGGTAGSSGCTIGYHPAGGNTANAFGFSVCDILDYRNTNKNTTIRSLNGWDGNLSGFISLNSGIWINTSAVTKITVAFDDGAAANSHIALYGMRG